MAVVGAAETTPPGVIPDTSQIQLHAEAALNAMADAGLKPADIDGIATAGETPVTGDGSKYSRALGGSHPPTWVNASRLIGSIEALPLLTVPVQA
jgi:hypothetical protein